MRFARRVILVGCVAAWAMYLVPSGAEAQELLYVARQAEVTGAGIDRSTNRLVT